MTSTEWKALHPERWAEHQRNYRKRRRAPCRTCGLPLPFPSPGCKYHNDCKPDHSKKHRQRRLARLRAYKTARGCDRCGYKKCAAALDFHHRDPQQKKHRVWVPEGNEYIKCDLLCSNCHHEEHEDAKIQESGDVY